MKRVLVRATNWIGDAVMSLPALRALREANPGAHIAILAKPWVGDLYGREPFCDELIPYEAASGVRDLGSKMDAARALRGMDFDTAILLQNAFEAAMVAWVARIPRRIGYNRDGRGLLLTHPVPVPKPGEIPRHERYYYLELLRRAGLIPKLPQVDAIRLEGARDARHGGIELLRAAGLGDFVVGISPGAAYGTAKRWLPDRFAEAVAAISARTGASAAVFGSAAERPLCEEVAAALRKAGVTVRNFAGETTLAQFIAMAAACRVLLTNDSGAMHIASALGTPTVTVFGATDDTTTGPTGPLARVVREPVDCSPCLLRECPIDHRCMTRVDAARVARAALELLK